MNQCRNATLPVFDMHLYLDFSGGKTDRMEINITFRQLPGHGRR